jgi:hypothetical protein
MVLGGHAAAFGLQNTKIIGFGLLSVFLAELLERY